MPRNATFLLALLAPMAAKAAAVKGTVSLPEEAAGRRFPGYWKPIENGIVPVAPASRKGETAVVVEGTKDAAPAARTVTVQISGLAADPPLVIVGPGSVVELKNAGRATHELTIPAAPSLMPPERLAPGAVRLQRFSAPGAYVIRCQEYPDLSVSVLVVDSPSFAVADEHGAFNIGGVPEGRATLKVWSRGRWVDQRPLQVGPRSNDVSIKVSAAPER